MELCRALRVSRSPASRLRLRIGKLDMSCLGVPRTIVLLEQLEPEVLLYVIIILAVIVRIKCHLIAWLDPEIQRLRCQY